MAHLRIIFPLAILLIVPLYHPRELSALEGWELPYRLHLCGNVRLGLKFQCDPRWPSVEQEGTVLVILVSDPLVSMSINKSEIESGLLEQIDHEILKGMGIYTEGFQTEEAMVAGQKALMVKAFIKESPDTRLLDYYFINKKSLYTVSFAVHPQEHWDEFKFLIKQVGDSLTFLKYSEIYRMQQQRHPKEIVVLEYP